MGDGRKLAERLQVKYYDKALIPGLTKEFGLTVEVIMSYIDRTNR